MAAVRKSPLMELVWKIHPSLYRISGGLIGGRLMGVPILLLMTKGRRSGQQRSNALMYLADGERFVVAASYAGEPRHPAWWLNLEAEPRAEIQVGRKRIPVVASEAQGEERERLWAAIVAQESGFAEYEKRTTRHIPVVVLAPSGG